MTLTPVDDFIKHFTCTDYDLGKKASLFWQHYSENTSSSAT